MLITFSGMVGSGKSTHAKNVVRLLRGVGHSPYLMHFRQIGWRHLLRSAAIVPGRTKPTRSRRRRGEPFTLALQERHRQAEKRFSFCIFLGYLMYILRFRLLLWLHHRQHLVVLNRYFYDNFAHFRLTTRRDRFYLRTLLAVVPQPDLAFLLILSPECAHRRRPTYAFAALRQLAINYRELQQYINSLSVVITDDLHVGDDQESHHLQSEGWFISTEETAYWPMPRKEATAHLPVWARPPAHPAELALRAVVAGTAVAD